MAKQHGMVKLTGKIDQTSYYYAKEGGYQTRAINPNMSERVKNDPQFENTRLNANEFGSCASTAGAIVRGVNSRWRYLTLPGIDGRMTGACVWAMQQDTTHPFGQRVIPQTEHENIQDYYNGNVKSKFPWFIKNYIKDNIRWYDAENHLEFNGQLHTTEDFEQSILSSGADGFRIEVYSFRVLKSAYVGHVWQYTPASFDIEVSTYAGNDIPVTGNGGELIWDSMTPRLSFAPQNSQYIIGGMLTVITPYKTVSNRHILKQMGATAYWHSIPDTD